MNTPILNREFKHPEDGWYQIEPKGNHPNADAGVVQVIDDEACASIVNRFNSGADAGTLSHGTEMLIDHEHFSHDDGKETRAFGWLTRLQNRADGIYGKVRWSSTGSAAVDGGDYRFFSTEYNPDVLTIVNRDKTKVRPMALSGLSLTNRPNNRGGKPITNSSRKSGSDKDLPEPPANSPAGAQADIQNRKQSMKQIAQRLGLSADASEEAILGELTKLENRATTAEGQLAPITVERDTLKNRVTILDGEQIDADLDAHGIKDEAVRNRVKPVLVPMTNRADRVEFIKLIGKPEVKTTKPLTNRADSKTPGAKPEAGSEEADKATAQRITNRAHELKGNAPSRTFAQCWNQARGEVLAGK